MNELIATLMLRIGANSPYPTAGLPSPAVVTMTPEALTAEAYAHVPQVLPAEGVYARLPCRAAAEKDAYLLGGRHLAAHHVTDPLPNRNFWAHVYSRC